MDYTKILEGVQAAMYSSIDKPQFNRISPGMSLRDTLEMYNCAPGRHWTIDPATFPLDAIKALKRRGW